MEWIWNGLVGFVLGSIPTWVWFIAAGVAIGWAWKTFGWQGVLGGLAAVVTLGAYRQGWRDRDQRDAHEHVPDGMDAWVPSPKAKPKPVARPKPKRTFNPDTNTFE